jgi:hypothetical protein
MKNTYGKVSWLISETELIGISLGGDATTEHERGSRGIAIEFGYDYSAKSGVKARQVTCLPKSFGLVGVKYEKTPCLLLSSSTRRGEICIGTELRFSEAPSGNTSDTCAAWDANNFAILARSDDRAKLQQLFEAFQQKDVMVGGLLKSMFPRIGGLVFAVASQVPKQILLDTQQELDEVLFRSDILEKSNIKEELHKSGCRWSSLDTTIWADESKTSIKVLLNSSDDRSHYSGYFTIEDLREWSFGKGPIMKHFKA